MESSKLIFVYNADSGAINTLIHIAHKIVSPKTYACNLCGLMYGIVSEREEWKAFMKEFTNPVEFLHRDEFEKKYPGLLPKLPAIMLEREGKPVPFIGAEEIDRCKTTEELIELIRSRTR